MTSVLTGTLPGSVSGFGGQGHARFWRNSDLMIDLSDEEDALPNTALPTPIISVDTGAWRRRATDPFALCLDEPVVSAAPIPCDP